MTTQAAFSTEEWDMLVRLPRWVVGAASAAQTDNAQRSHQEVEAGFLGVAEGRELGSVLVRDIAQSCMGLFDTNEAGAAAAGVMFTDAEEDLAVVLDRIRTATQLLRAKAETQDADTYSRWIVAITDVVIKATRTGDRFGVGGELVTDSEQRFRDQVVLAVQG